MDANHIANLILSSIKKSNLNFYIQESPFSLSINLRKTFIKNKNGNPLLPPSDFFVNANTVKVDKLEEQNACLNDSLEQLGADLSKTKIALKELKTELEKSTKELEINLNENKALVQRNDELYGVIETLKSDVNIAMKNLKIKDNEIKRLESSKNSLEEQLKNKRTENECLLDENQNIFNEKQKLEIKLTAVTKPAIRYVHKSTGTSTAQIDTKTETEPALSNLHVVGPVISSPSPPAPAVSSSPTSSPACHPPTPASVHTPCTPPGWPSSISQPQSARNNGKESVAVNNKNIYEESDVVENNNHEEIGVIKNNNIAEKRVVENVKPKCILSAEVQEIIKADKVDFEKLVEAVRRDKIGCDLPNDEDEDSYSNYEYEEYPDEYWNSAEILNVTDKVIDDQMPDKI